MLTLSYKFKNFNHEMAGRDIDLNKGIEKWQLFIANNQFGSFEEAIIIYSGLKYSHQRHGNAITKVVIQYFKNTTRSAYC